MACQKHSVLRVSMLSLVVRIVQHPQPLLQPLLPFFTEPEEETSHMQLVSASVSASPLVCLSFASHKY